MDLKRKAKQYAPGLVRVIQKTKRRKLQRSFAPLSLQDRFDKIYRDNMWGGTPNDYCSGSGSNPDVTEAYCRYVNSLISEYRPSTILDVGCGDFQVGSRLVLQGSKYIGMDIVPGIVSRNNDRYSSSDVKFIHGDLTAGNLPAADLVLVRQVLQHLSNSSISEALSNLRTFHRIVITEHFPPINDRFRPNVDKSSGPDIRLVDDSAVVLSAPPFSIENIDEVLVSPADINPMAGTIRTFLYQPQWAHHDEIGIP